MKARSITKTALSVLVFAFAGTLSGVAQQVASPSAAPAVDHVKASAAEKVFIQRMAAAVEAGRKSGSLDMKAVSAILGSAVKAGVSDAVMAQMVSMAAEAFPVNAPPSGFRCRQELRLQGYGSPGAQYRICRRFRSAQALRFCFSDLRSGDQGSGSFPRGDDTMPSIAVEVAAGTPDNPLQGVTTQTRGIVQPGEDAAGGALVMPGGVPVGGTPTSPAPVSNPSGN